MASLSALMQAREVVASHLDAVLRLFEDGARITLLVRFPSHPDGSRDFQMGDDDLQEAIRALQQRIDDRQGFTIASDA